MSAGIVVGVGHCTVDYLGLLPRYPDRTESAEIAEFSQQGGGATATALATLAIFGVETRFIGKVSDDHFGLFIRKGLEGLGIDTSQLVIEPDRVSPFSFRAVEQAGGRPTVFWSHGNVSPLTIDELDESAVLEGATTILVDGQHPEVQFPIALAAKHHSIPVILDAASAEEETIDLIRQATVLIASERLAIELAPAPELEESLAKFRELGPSQCVITLGAEGAIGISKSGTIHQEPAFRIEEEKDITGAGDVYLGAMTYALLESWPLPRAMHFASVAAGLTCQSLGARAGIPRLSQVLESAKSGKD